MTSVEKFGNGRRLCFTYSIGNFSTLRCLEQIRNDVCYHSCDVTVITVGAGFSMVSLALVILPLKI